MVVDPVGGFSTNPWIHHGLFGIRAVGTTFIPPVLNRATGLIREGSCGFMVVSGGRRAGTIYGPRLDNW